jgi:hypothetical protein
MTRVTAVPFVHKVSLHSSITLQTDAAFDSIYYLSNYLFDMFRATSAHHQEFSLLYMQPPAICVAACPWHCLVVNKFTTRQCHGQAATQITGGCMYSRENTADDERMSLETSLQQDSATDRQQHR